MTAVVERPTARTRPSRILWGLALLMPVGPAAVALLRYLLPYGSSTVPAEMVTGALAHPGRQSAVLWLSFVAVLTLVPGVLALAQLTRGLAPRLTAWALALTVPAYLSLGGLVYPDQVLWSGTEIGVDPATTTALLSTVHPTVNLSIVVFVLGHVVGTVLFGVALLRTGVIPAWAAWALTVSQPLHFVAAVFLDNPPLDLFAWTLTALAMAVAARVLLRDRPALPGRRSST